MTQEAPKSWRTPFAYAGGGFVLLSAVVLAVTAVDAYVVDFADGDNPLERNDGSFRSILRDFNERPPEGTPESQWTPHQRITSVGMGLTMASILFGTPSFRKFSIGTALTLATHGGYEALEATTSGDLIKLLFYSGASAGTLGGALVTFGTEPKSFGQQVSEGVQKVKDVGKRVRGTKGD